MCNCGKKRIEYSSRQNDIHDSVEEIEIDSDSTFEYTGKTALTVTGNRTGNRYRFFRPGDIQPVDYRDVAGMVTIPVLKKVR
ncbi:MAG TPA: hypothetical protein PLD84_13860 [Chitinophagales bacterium]|nr:hypothetical protein [Chitinophagales bacterium]